MKNKHIYHALLNQWNEQYRTLHDILNCEQRALEKRDFDLLSSLVKEKNQLIKEINQQQVPAIINQGCISQPKINQVKKYCIENPELQNIWNELMSLVEQCNFKNEINSRLITLITASTKRTFNLIKGFDPDNNIYTASGDRTLVRHYGQSLSA